MTFDVDELSPIIPQPIELDDDKTPEPHHKPFSKTLLAILYKLQKYSAYSFLGFYGLHTTTVNILPGIRVPMDMCQETFEIARSVYTAAPVDLMISSSMVVHVLCGISIRYLRRSSANHRRRINNNSLLVKENTDADYGLGGITALIGLGSRRSIVSNLTSLSPISFSGFILIPLIWFHRYKFKLSAIEVDDDRSLITLQYIGVVLNHSLVKYGNILNWCALTMLIVASSYHFVSGMLRFQHRYSKRDKKWGYGVIGAVITTGLLSLMRLKSHDFGNDYLFKSFMKYVTFTRI